MQNYNESIQFKKRVMRKIYAIWFFKKAFNLKTGLMLLVVWQVTMYVSVVNIFINTPSLLDAVSMYRFMLDAFLHTEIIVKLFSVFIVILAMLFLKDAVKAIFNFIIPVRVKGRFN